MFINEQIRDKEVRLIDADGNQQGVVTLEVAINMAEEAGLDLVKIAPNAAPPVCKIMDYGKYKYQLAKKAAEAKKKSTVIQIKEMKLGLKIDEHDLGFKVKQIRGFLDDGCKVKIIVMFKGREMLHIDVGEKLAQRIVDSVKDVGTLDQKLRFDGRNIVMIFSPL
ncbi:MAG TPA: translation initiation factor IF-3 [Syntrophorhabdus aromaticivorans]|nr:translation initiation factor IF-3 [Syntrophorhabdus aromaticivorans]